MEKIELLKVNIKNNRIDYKFEISDALKRFFTSPISFWVEYEEDLSSVPESIACIPFVENMLPLAWVTDAELIIPKLDEDYFRSIPETRKAFTEIYPHFGLKGKLVCNETEKNLSPNLPEDGSRKATSFFSGGAAGPSGRRPNKTLLGVLLKNSYQEENHGRTF